jgi:hypothetical protein
MAEVLTDLEGIGPVEITRYAGKVAVVPTWIGSGEFQARFDFIVGRDHRVGALRNTLVNIKNQEGSRVSAAWRRVGKLSAEINALVKQRAIINHSIMMKRQKYLRLRRDEARPDPVPVNKLRHQLMMRLLAIRRQLIDSYYEEQRKLNAKFSSKTGGDHVYQTLSKIMADAGIPKYETPQGIRQGLTPKPFPGTSGESVPNPEGAQSDDNRPAPNGNDSVRGTESDGKLPQVGEPAQPENATNQQVVLGT